MGELFVRLFSDNVAGPTFKIFGTYHILLLLLLISIITVSAFLLVGRTKETKNKVLNIIAIFIVFLYLSDFFVHPFMNQKDALVVDKLPFHLCTICCPLIVITRLFKDKTKAINHAVPILGLIGGLMYLTYPTALDGNKVFCYRSVQTIIYHSTIVAYGILSMTTGDIELSFKKIYVEAIMILCLDLISIGANKAYGYIRNDDYNWFFTSSGMFGIADKLMPYVMFGVIFTMSAIIYGFYYVLKDPINNSKFVNSLRTAAKQYQSEHQYE